MQFYFIAQNLVDPFWKEVRHGLEAAAKEHKVVVEFNAPRFNNPQEELKYFDIAVTSDVDGIITHVSSGSEFTAMIDKAKGVDAYEVRNMSIDIASRLAVLLDKGNIDAIIIKDGFHMKEEVYRN